MVKNTPFIDMHIIQWITQCSNVRAIDCTGDFLRATRSYILMQSIISWCGDWKNVKLVCFRSMTYWMELLQLLENRVLCLMGR